MINTILTQLDLSGDGKQYKVNNKMVVENDNKNE